MATEARALVEAHGDSRVEMDRLADALRSLVT
jgi:hypothetical protein